MKDKEFSISKINSKMYKVYDTEYNTFYNNKIYLSMQQAVEAAKTFNGGGIGVKNHMYFADKTKRYIAVRIKLVPEIYS